MATGAEKEAKAAAAEAAKQAVVQGRQRLAGLGESATAFPQRRLRSAGDMARYAIGGFMDDPTKPRPGGGGSGTPAPRPGPVGTGGGGGVTRPAPALQVPRPIMAGGKKAMPGGRGAPGGSRPRRASRRWAARRSRPVPVRWAAPLAPTSPTPQRRPHHPIRQLRPPHRREEGRRDVQEGQGDGHRLHQAPGRPGRQEGCRRSKTITGRVTKPTPMVKKPTAKAGGSSQKKRAE